MTEVVMDEVEWLTGTDAGRLIDHVHTDPWRWPRKYRLLNCACGRRLAPWFADDPLAPAIDRAESWADGELTERTLRRWMETVERLRGTTGRPRHEDRALGAVVALLSDTRTQYPPHLHAWRALGPDRRLFGRAFAATAPEVLLGLVRDVYGNPFRPVAFDPGWRTSAAVALARTMYESRDFAHMPILADALEDAGCDHPDVIAHCRDPHGVHVRGCWVVDGVLGLS